MTTDGLPAKALPSTVREGMVEGIMEREGLSREDAEARIDAAQAEARAEEKG